MISAPSRWASAIPTRVLPTAVAPVRNQQFANLSPTVLLI